MSKRNRGGPSATPSQPPEAPKGEPPTEPVTPEATEPAEEPTEQPTETTSVETTDGGEEGEKDEITETKPAVPGADTPPPTEPVLESASAKTGFVRAKVIGPGAVKCGRWYPEGSEGNFPASVVDSTPQLQKI